MSEAKVADIDAMEIVDCRLEPTLRVTVRTTDGVIAHADVPAGRSTGKHEPHELRDRDERYAGKGVRTAVENVRTSISDALEGVKIENQRKIDKELIELDGTADRSGLGGNALTGTSLAVLKAAAKSLDVSLYRYIGTAGGYSLPVPLFDMIEGGKLADTKLDFQEHQLVPVGADSFEEALRASAEVYYELADVLEENHGQLALNVGVEGGYTPQIDDPRDALDYELEAVERCGYNGEFAVAIDAAASHFYDPDSNTYELMGETLDRDDLIGFYEELVTDYPLVSMEDPLDQEDFEGYAELTDRIGNRVQIIGDDLFVTNLDRVQRGIDEGAANALLLKVNQAGTVTEAIDAATLARNHGYEIQVSERSGQTPDTWLADLAVGLNAGQIKTGVSRGERTEQYNRLLEIANAPGAEVPLAEWPYRENVQGWRGEQGHD